MKKYELTEEQLKYLLSIDSIKDEVKKWFGVEDKLEENKYYIYENKAIQFNKKDGKGYGINFFGDWVEEIEWLNNSHRFSFRLATPKEVEEALTKEAVKRGLTNIGEISIIDEKGKSFKKGCFTTSGNEYYYYEKSNTFLLDGVIIFKQGVWAEIIEDKTPKDIQELINKYGKNELLKLLKDE